MSARAGAPEPFDEFRLVLIDGHNLLHRLVGTAAAEVRAPYLSRIAAIIPRGVDTILVLDGPPDAGGPLRGRVRPGFEVRHSGRHDADDALVALVEARPFSDRAAVVVVTDDRELGDRVRRSGGRVRRLDWLTSRAGMVSKAARRQGIGGPVPYERREVRALDGDGEPATTDRGWRPGRGATRKRGNPCRQRARRSGGRGGG